MLAVWLKEEGNSMNMKNIYQTKQRKAVMDYLAQNQEHVYSIGEIADVVSAQKGIGKSTVYRVVHHLAEEGIVRLFREENSKSFLCSYIGESRRCSEHFHLKCMQCGRLFHTDCKLLDEIRQHFYTEHSFIINAEKTVFYGLCKKCREEMTEK